MRLSAVNHGVTLTTLGFGAASIGNLHASIDDDTAQQVLHAAWSAGIRYFDTAPHYGLGLSEKRLGEALTNYQRDDFCVSTKVGRLLTRNLHPTGSDLCVGGFDVPDELTREFDYTRIGVLRSIEQSLQRLGMDRIDIAYVHDPENHMADAIEYAIPTLLELRDQGVIRAVGVGMNSTEPLHQIVTHHPDIDVVMIAGRWTLLDRSGVTVLEACLARDVGVVVAAPFNSGLLATPQPLDGALFNYAPALAPIVKRARELARICDTTAASLPQAAIQFPLRHPAVRSVVVGIRTREQAEQNVMWAESPLDARTWAALDAFDLERGIGSDR